MSEFTTWEEMSTLEQMASQYWDMYKDAHGIRPRGIDTSSWTEADFNKEFEELNLISELFAWVPVTARLHCVGSWMLATLMAIGNICAMIWACPIIIFVRFLEADNKLEQANEIYYFANNCTTHGLCFRHSTTKLWLHGTNVSRFSRQG
jgi:hypothetical protein